MTPSTAAIGGFAAVVFSIFFLAICISLVVTARESAAWFRSVMDSSRIPMPRSRETAVKNMTPASAQMHGVFGSVIASVVVFNVVASNIRMSLFSPASVAWILLCAGVAGASAAVAVVSLIGGISEGLGASARVRAHRLTIGRWALVAFGITVAAGSVLAGLR